MQKMYLLFAVSDHREKEAFLALYRRHEVPLVYTVPCHGTAQEKTLDIMGLEASEKLAHFSLVTRNLAEEMMDALTVEWKMDLPQRGIALLMPLSSISGATALSLHADGHEHDEMKKEPYEMETDKELIVVICESGYADTVMQAARGAGAGGGTVVHAMGSGTELAQKFMGMSLAEEKDMIFIVTRTDRKREIMRAISVSAGGSTPARAVSFSLPVSETAGLRFFEE